MVSDSSSEIIQRELTEDGFGQQIQKIRADAIREFMQRLKEEDGESNHNFDDNSLFFCVSQDYINGRKDKTEEIWETIRCLAKTMAGNHDSSPEPTEEQDNA